MYVLRRRHRGEVSALAKVVVPIVRNTELDPIRLVVLLGFMARSDRPGADATFPATS